jgi:hypothetical protein
MMKKTFLLFMTLMLLAACKVNVAGMLSDADSFKVYVYEKGRPIQDYKIVKGDERYQMLIQWAEENGSGWQMTPATYVPGVMVSGGEVSINFLGSLAILNGPDGQFEKDVIPSDYAFLK